MAYEHFLAITQQVVQETGLAGGDPSNLETVEGQSGDLLDAVSWTRDACLQIDNLWFTWRYHWFEWSTAFALANGQTPPAPTAYTVRRWDRDSFWLNKTAAGPRKLRYEDWRTFRTRTGAAPQGKPSVITVRPDLTLRTDKIPATSMTFTAEGYRRPTILSADDDEPDMPEEFRRIIVCRAKILYADARDAPEILEGAQAEYSDILDKLQSDQLESHEMDRMSEQDLDLSIGTPGY
jgi:hypothetical protein